MFWCRDHFQTSWSGSLILCSMLLLRLRDNKCMFVHANQLCFWNRLRCRCRLIRWSEMLLYPNEECLPEYQCIGFGCFITSQWKIPMYRLYYMSLDTCYKMLHINVYGSFSFFNGKIGIQSEDKNVVTADMCIFCMLDAFHLWVLCIMLHSLETFFLLAFFLSI